MFVSQFPQGQTPPTSPWEPPPPGPPLTAPGVNLWFKVYVIFLAVLYGLVMILGIVLMLMPDVFADEMSDEFSSPEEALVMGGVYGGVGFVFALLYLVPLFLPRKTGTWIYGIVLIALSLTSCCTWPAAIPLLIFWVKNDNRRWFGMS